MKSQILLLMPLLIPAACAGVTTLRRPRWTAPRRSGRESVPWERPRKHVTDAYPLSDQQNKGGWMKFEPMSDEFEGKELDRTNGRSG